MVDRIALKGSYRKNRNPVGTITALNPFDECTVSLILRPEEPIPDLETTSFDLQSRKRLTRREFADKHSYGSDGVEAVLDFAHDFSLTLKSNHPASRMITLAGTIQNVCEAFGVYLYGETINGKTYRARRGYIYIPTNLANHVETVFGLDSRPAPKNFRGSQAAPATTLADFPAYTRFASEVANLYHFPNGDCKDQVIGILAFGGGYLTSDLEQYFAQLKIPPPSISAVSVLGKINAPGSDPESNADLEVTMDLQVAAAIAPGARFVVYFSEWSSAGVLAALNAAIHDDINKPTIISCSWGAPEDDDSFWAEDSITTSFESLLQAAAHMNISVCCASGDSGSSCGVDLSAHCLYPASSAYVLSVGGTTLPDLANETVWNSSGCATGGGISSIISPVSWQTSISKPISASASQFAGRGIPDVAANADFQTGYRLFFQGSWTWNGGTSAATPLWAGLLARFNQNTKLQLGFVTPIFYEMSDCFNDITVGNNGAYSATVGWDCCSGLGSPNGEALAAKLLTM